MTTYAPALYTGDGTTTTFPVPFDYLNRTDVQIAVDGATAVNYSWTSPSTIRFDAAPAVSAEITIRRHTSIDSATSGFAPGNLSGADLRRAFNQLIYNIQERGLMIGVAPVTAPPHTFLTGLTEAGAFTVGQPSYEDLSGAPLGVRNIFSVLTRAQIIDITSRALTLDLTATLQAALDGFGPNVTVQWPAGSYKVSGTLVPPLGQNQEGVSYGWNGGTAIVAATGLNSPVFKLTSAQAVRRFAFIGCATATTPSQIAVYVNNANGVTVDKCFFALFYTAIYLDGSSSFTTLEGNAFMGHTYGLDIEVFSNTAAGVGLNTLNNYFASAAATAIGSVRMRGLGAWISTNDTWTAGIVGSGPVVDLDYPAALAGNTQITGSTIESGGNQPALRIGGTALLPWYRVQLANCNVNGGVGAAIVSSYSTLLMVSNTTLGGDTPGLSGIVQFPDGSANLRATFSTISFDGSSTDNCFKAGAVTELSLSIFSPQWNGSGQFLNCVAAAAANIKKLDVIGGNLGTSPTPYGLPTGAIPGVLTYPDHILIDNLYEAAKQYRSAAPVNELVLTSADTGVSPSLAAVGTDPNIDLVLIPKGSGRVVMATAAHIHSYLFVGLPAGSLGDFAVLEDGAAGLAWGATVSGGGTTRYLIWHNGTTWTVAGK